jgi:hypothetical protein
MLITYLEYFGFVIRVNQKRVDDLITRDINTKLSRLNDTTGILELCVDKMKINKVSSTGKGYCHPISTEDNNEKDVLNELNNRDYDMSMNQFKEKALSLAQTRIVNRGYTDCQVMKVSDRTIGRIINKLHIKEGNTEETTSARAETTSCIRNTVSFIVMN